VPLVADFFADADTKLTAQACHKLGNLKRGFQWQTLASALEALTEAAPSPPLGLVYGAGFEDRPNVLAKIAKRWPILGNDSSVVERVKAPETFFAELARLGISHPNTVTEPSRAKPGWLAKHRGGAGGSHIVTRMPRKSGIADDSVYFQEKVDGRPVSALFAAADNYACVLGFSEQWAAPIRQAKWRYGGAVRPAALSPDLEAQLTDVVERAAPCFALKGLCSADFLVKREGAQLLEINPRPGATLDIFDSEAEPLLRLHLQAVLDNRLPTAPLTLPAATAAAIVYATEPVTVSNTMTWPEWTADRPLSGERIDKHRPICTVLARAETRRGARQLVMDRIANILAACTG